MLDDSNGCVLENFSYLLMTNSDIKVRLFCDSWMRKLQLTANTEKIQLCGGGRDAWRHLWTYSKPLVMCSACGLPSPKRNWHFIWRRNRADWDKWDCLLFRCRLSLDNLRQRGRANWFLRPLVHFMRRLKILGVVWKVSRLNPHRQSDINTSVFYFEPEAK